MKKVSLKSILDTTYAKTRFLENLNQADAIIYALEVLRLIAHPLIYKEKTGYFAEVANYKASLPCDLIQINQIMGIVSGTNLQIVDNVNIVDTVAVGDPTMYSLHTVTYQSDPLLYRIPMRIDTNKFENPTEESLTYGDKGAVYRIDGDVITTEFETGYIELSYKGMELDEDNLPMIPDDVSVSLAIQAYIKLVYANGLYEIGQFTEGALNRIERDYNWYIGQAESSLRMSDINNADYRESWSNLINRQLVDKTAHDRGYKDLGSREYLKKY